MWKYTYGTEHIHSSKHGFKWNIIMKLKSTTDNISERKQNRLSYSIYFFQLPPTCKAIWLQIRLHFQQFIWIYLGCYIWPGETKSENIHSQIELERKMWMIVKQHVLSADFMVKVHSITFTQIINQSNQVACGSNAFCRSLNFVCCFAFLHYHIGLPQTTILHESMEIPVTF